MWAQAILAILQLIPDLIALIKGIGAENAKRKIQEWRKELDAVNEDIKNARTNEERIAAAKRLSDLS